MSSTNNNTAYPEEFYAALRARGHDVAANYRQRASKIIEQIFWQMKAFVDPKLWKEVSPEQINAMVDELPGILNRSSKYTGKVYSGLPLTEKEISDIEDALASLTTTIVNVGEYTVISTERKEKKTNDGDA